MASSGLRQLAERELMRAEFKAIVDSKIAELASTFRAALATDGAKLDQSLARLDALLTKWETGPGDNGAERPLTR
jgi:hypothetical protein